MSFFVVDVAGGIRGGTGFVFADHGGNLPFFVGVFDAGTVGEENFAEVIFFVPMVFAGSVAGFLQDEAVLLVEVAGGV